MIQYRRCAINRKFTIRINGFAFNLFSYFISHHELVLLASIINDNIQFERLIDDQNEIEIDSNSLIELDGYSPGKSFALVTLYHYSHLISPLLTSLLLASPLHSTSLTPSFATSLVSSLASVIFSPHLFPR